MTPGFPKTLHRIWLGTKPIPRRFEGFWATWADHHPDWELVTWTDSTIPPLRNQAAFDAAKTFAMKSDLARYELLYEHGGVYVDADFEALRNIEPLLEGVELFAAWEDEEYVGNAILGAVPHHPGLQAVIKAVPDSIASNANRTPNHQTGPGLITRVLVPIAAAERSTVKLFEPALFYPYHWQEPERDGDTFPDAYAVHHWSVSWSRPSRLPASIRSLPAVEWMLALSRPWRRRAS
jgi:mannosyltransferase OCH1-like enzyme